MKLDYISPLLFLVRLYIIPAIMMDSSPLLDSYVGEDRVVSLAIVFCRTDIMSLTSRVVPDCPKASNPCLIFDIEVKCAAIRAWQMKNGIGLIFLWTAVELHRILLIL